MGQYDYKFTNQGGKAKLDAAYGDIGGKNRFLTKEDRALHQLQLEIAKDLAAKAFAATPQTKEKPRRKYMVSDLKPGKPQRKSQRPAPVVESVPKRLAPSPVNDPAWERGPSLRTFLRDGDKPPECRSCFLMLAKMQ